MDKIGEKEKRVLKIYFFIAFVFAVTVTYCITGKKSETLELLQSHNIDSYSVYVEGLFINLYNWLFAAATVYCSSEYFRNNPNFLMNYKLNTNQMLKTLILLMLIYMLALSVICTVSAIPFAICSTLTCNYIFDVLITMIIVFIENKIFNYI